MTEEEKEAIEWLERLVKINKRDNLFNTYAEILLNVIQKQSKIIEELKDMNERQQYRIELVSEDKKFPTTITKEELEKRWKE